MNSCEYNSNTKSPQLGIRLSPLISVLSPAVELNSEQQLWRVRGLVEGVGARPQPPAQWLAPHIYVNLGGGLLLLRTPASIWPPPHYVKLCLCWAPAHLYSHCGCRRTPGGPPNQVLLWSGGLSGVAATQGAPGEAIRTQATTSPTGMLILVARLPAQNPLLEVFSKDGDDFHPSI